MATVTVLSTPGWETLNLKVPKLRQGSYFPGFLEARKTSEQAPVAMIQKARICGISTRKVDDLVRAMRCPATVCLSNREEGGAVGHVQEHGVEAMQGY